MYLFNRSITVNVQMEEENIVIIQGVFLDSHHELCLTLKVDFKNNEIVAANGEFRRSPHIECKQIEVKIKDLVGINLNGNVRCQVLKAVGLEHGCTHVTDLTLECVKGLVQSRLKLMHLTLSTEETKDLVEDYLSGTCLYYKK